MSNAVPIIFTNSAAQKAYSLIQEEEEGQDLKLRVFISGGGCSGYQYGFTFDKNVNEGDTIVEKKLKKTHSNKNADSDGDGGDSGGSAVVQLLIDSGSIQYLANAEIDFRDSPGGGEFVIRNPNAKTTCGCGSSFGV